ncbi:hypothetical protein LB505_005562 [Fusarium chuoi]|nr:hypothetical protein LB505_005562 [Fusarium chuoi]
MPYHPAATLLHLSLVRKDSKGQHQPEVSMPHDANSPSSIVKRRPKAARTDAVRKANCITETGPYWRRHGIISKHPMVQYHTYYPKSSENMYNMMNLLSSIQHAIGTARDDTGCSMPMGNA